jgi:hypothetical protein
MGEPHAIAFDHDDAFAFGLVEQFHSVFGGGADHLRQQLNRWFRRRRGGQQDIAGLPVETADSKTHQPGQCAGQRRLSPRRTHVNRPGQFECVERVAP